MIPGVFTIFSVRILLFIHVPSSFKMIHKTVTVFIFFSVFLDPTLSSYSAHVSLSILVFFWLSVSSCAHPPIEKNPSLCYNEPGWLKLRKTSHVVVITMVVVVCLYIDMILCEIYLCSVVMK